VAAIGNVYTRRDRRRLGLAAALTSAMAGELLALRLPTIALSVAQANTAAIRIYERLGFVKRCEFIEGYARRN
jgi:predicted GNAT family acetyltransferase